MREFRRLFYPLYNMATFDAPDYEIGNSATIQAQLSSVLSTLDQALQALQPAPNATTVKFNDTILLDDGTTNTNTIDNTSTTISAVGSFGTQTNITDKIGIQIKEDDGLGHYGKVELQRDNLNFAFTDPPTSYDFEMGLYANTGGGLCGIQHIERSSATRSNLTLSTNENLVFTADNIDLSSDGRLIVPSLASGEYLDYNPTTANFTLTTNNIGGQANPILTLKNSSATVGNTNGVPSIETYKNGRNAVAGDVIYSQHHYALDAGAQKTEFGRIRTVAVSSTIGAEHGSVGIWCSRNGGINEVFTFNGASNDNNSLRPLDMNDNNILTTIGDLKLDATASSTTGNVNISAKTTGVVNINSNVVMDNSESFVQRNPAFTIYNNQTTNSISLVDTSMGGILNENLNSNISQILRNGNTLEILTNESYCNSQSIVKFDNTLNLVKEHTDIYSNHITINEFPNPNTEQVDIYPTYITFQRSGSAVDSLSMYNDSADGGEIDWTNSTGSNGLTISSNKALTIKAPTATEPLQFDSDVINLQNTNTTTSTNNHNADIKATSTGLESTTFLKLQLNGNDIWLPYFTSDPSL